MCRSLAAEAGGLVARVAVSINIHHLLAPGHVPRSAHPALEDARRRPEVVLVVDLELGRRDGAVVREGRPAADRHPPAAHDLVDAQDVHRRIDRVPVAARVLRHAAVAALLDDAVVREVGLEAAVLGDAQQLARPPARDGRSRVALGALDRPGDLADQEAVEHRVGGLRRQEVDERVRVGDRAGARRDRVVGLVVGEPARPAVGVGGRDEHVPLGEAGALGGLLDEAAGAREQVERDQRHLAAPALQHHRGREEARVLSLPGAVGPHEAAERVARLRRDVRASHARAQRSGGVGGRRGRESGDQRQCRGRDCHRASQSLSSTSPAARSPERTAPSM